MKNKVLAVMLAVIIAVLTFGFAGCKNASSNAAASDFDAIKSSGKLVIGITIFDPMNYYAEDGVTLTGFDTDFATAACEKLGVTPEFQIINWETKEIELNAKKIDVIWNGFTVTEEGKQNIDFTNSYMFNKQCVVVKAENADKYQSTADLDGLSVVAEKGSAGEDAIQGDEFLSKNYTSVQAQTDTLLEVKSGTADAAVLDYVMAKASVGDGTSYSDLAIVEGIDLAYEEYAIGCRKGSDLDEKLNDVMAELVADGTIETIAEKYDLTANLITK
ncbi:MAG: transporter substrate-binding domain-containing protein [Clostridiales bacterium]|nr:transporter substrate-binding domain-containing protein [Clostridiales bacterium]